MRPPKLVRTLQVGEVQIAAFQGLGAEKLRGTVEPEELRAVENAHALVVGREHASRGIGAVVRTKPECRALAAALVELAELLPP